MTRLWPAGENIAMQTAEDGSLIAFIWHGNRHQVTALSNQWQLDLDWWDQRIWRDYFKLATDTCLLVIVYHDLLTDTWLLQRLYD